MADEPWSPEFFARRQAARAHLDAMNPHMKPGDDVDPATRAKWFSIVYDLAGDDPAGIPWARLAPNPFLLEWLSREGPLTGKRALDVGCGLGDNAEGLAAAGARVSAFDYVARAIDWARRRFPETSVDYRTADLFALPGEWRGAFDLVHECYTLQALESSQLSQAAQALAGLVAPNGRLLVITSARDEHEPQTTPWRPLTRVEIESLCVGGLALKKLEDIPARSEFLPRHWRATFEKLV
jgi:2-polyprenyl-3-methyl-5-hydroxy-6-metoxy-1,4-benzoquinol methylase